MFYFQEEARRSNKVSSLVNVDDFEVTQRVGHVAFSHRGKIWVSQACHLDILMKTQGKKLKLKRKKLKTQDKKKQKLKDFLKTLKIHENLSNLCTNFHSKGTF